MTDFQRQVADLKRNIENARKDGVSLVGAAQSSVADFKSQQVGQLRSDVLNGIESVAKAAYDVQDATVSKLASQLSTSRDLKQLDELTDKLLELVTGDDAPKSLRIKKPKVPSEIAGEINADIDEVNRCMDSQSYRSAVILCGRILETALHRKYYEATSNDLLDKSPGIGLGNLIAKLNDRGVKLDPALGNQIHLINQVRIHSVHKKQDAFRPSPAQAQAIVLYTMDVLEKLFV